MLTVIKEKHRALGCHSLAFCSLNPWALNTTQRLTSLRSPDQSGLQPPGGCLAILSEAPAVVEGHPYLCFCSPNLMLQHLPEEQLEIQLTSLGTSVSRLNPHSPSLGGFGSSPTVYWATPNTKSVSTSQWALLIMAWLYSSSVCLQTSGYLLFSQWVP